MTSHAWLARPAATADPATRTRHRGAGLVLAVAGMMIVVVKAITVAVNLTQGPGAQLSRTLTGAFAANTFGLGVTKLGIAVVLMDIFLALWRRVGAVSFVLPVLRSASPAHGPVTTGTVTTPHGRASVTARAPAPLPLHRMAERAWLPVLAMGGVALVVGLLVGIAATGQIPGGESSRALSAWAQGTLFLGEGLLLSGISLLLGTILSALRRGGSEVQESLGATVQTLVMPRTAKLFIGLMMVGMMAAIAQFVLYGAAASIAGNTAAFAVRMAWLGPLREVALGVLLAGIVLALASIARVVGFQFDRIQQLTATHTTTTPITRRTRTYRRRVRAALRTALQRAADRGEIDAEYLDGRVQLLFGMVLGLNIAVRGGASHAEVDAISSGLRQQIEGWRLIGT